MPPDCMLPRSRWTDVSNTNGNACADHRPVELHERVADCPSNHHKKAFTTKLIESHFKPTTTSTCCEGRCGSPLLKGATRSEESTERSMQAERRAPNRTYNEAGCARYHHDEAHPRDGCVQDDRGCTQHANIAKTPKHARSIHT